ncbi:MAG: AraC family transcriptional regulator [Gammaproteobacteria bacterium]|nr:AraC family transcriptional regulator [Gammaproteobacteria bacterium]
MTLDIVPCSLYPLDNVRTFLSNKNSSIIYKSLRQNIIDAEVYIKSVVIIYVTRGEQIIRKYDGAEIVVSEDELVMLPKDVYLASDLVTDHNLFESFLFFIDDSIIEKFCLLAKSNKESKTSKNLPDLYTSSADHLLKAYIRSLLEVYGNIQNSIELLELKLLELMFLLALQDNGNHFTARLSNYKKPAAKRNIKSFMEQYYLKNLGLEDYALLTGRSVATFIRDFKNIYSVTPNQWLIDKRLEKAREFLVNQDWPVTETALEVGYESTSHFIKAYKAKYGLTPNKDRKKF